MEISDLSAQPIYHHEIALAKLAIRNYYLSKIVKSIYENTGQLLSLVRIQLAVIKTECTDHLLQDLNESGNLVAQVIFNLREISKNLYPEKELLAEYGLVNALRQELNIPPADPPDPRVLVTGIPCALPAGAGLVFIAVIIDVLTQVLEVADEKTLALAIKYHENAVTVTIRYPGKALELDVPASKQEASEPMKPLSVMERIRIIGGRANAQRVDDHQAQVLLEIMLND